ncbi:MAG: biotin--[acetyl-CoA-carboxylase] ligase [Bacteroidales bacterium]|nr:biotin--[acetyl-CoA-carboxylase] ligase [Bacteroidales bacterium]
MGDPSTERNIIWLESTDSTNNELRRRLNLSGNLTIIAAERQSAGRGQGDHTWHSEPGRNLTFSVLLRHRCLKASDALAVTSIMALGIRDYLHTKGIEPWIKWPNDIWVSEKKICGILVENSMRAGKIDFSIVGVGLDLNQTEWPSDLPNPVSLKELTGTEYDAREELRQLCDALAARSAQTATPEGVAGIIAEFNRVVVRLDRADSANNRLPLSEKQL